MLAFDHYVSVAFTWDESGVVQSSYVVLFDPGVDNSISPEVSSGFFSLRIVFGRSREDYLLVLSSLCSIRNERMRNTSVEFLYWF